MQRALTILPQRPSNVSLKLEMSLLKSMLDNLYKAISTDISIFENNAKTIQNFSKNRNITNLDLRMLKILMNFDAYTLQTRMSEPNFYDLESILLRFRNMKRIIENMLDCVTQEGVEEKIVVFTNEPECVQQFQSIFSESLFARPYFRKICSILYRSVLDGKTNKPLDLFVRHMYETIKLFLFGISLPSSYAEDYPLHSAIFNSDTELVRKICEGTQTNCFYAHTEEADPAGISPLLLAIKLQREQIVNILLENGADPRHRVIPKHRFPMEEAVNTKNKAILRALVLGGYQLRLNRWVKTMKGVLDFLETIPDFSFDLQWECDSGYIPFVSRIAPSDTHKIYKKGSSLRMDSTIAGIKKLKVTRGNISFFLLGKEHPGYEGKLLMVNHGKNTVTDLMTEVDLKRLGKQVDYMAKRESLPNEVKPHGIQFEPAKTWRGESVIEKIGEYRTVKYNAKGTVSMLYTKKANDEIGKFDTYEKYFEDCFPTRFWAPTAADGMSFFSKFWLIAIFSIIHP